MSLLEGSPGGLWQALFWHWAPKKPRLQSLQTLPVKCALQLQAPFPSGPVIHCAVFFSTHEQSWSHSFPKTNGWAHWVQLSPAKRVLFVQLEHSPFPCGPALQMPFLVSQVQVWLQNLPNALGSVHFWH